MVLKIQLFKLEIILFVSYKKLYLALLFVFLVFSDIYRFLRAFQTFAY